MKKLFVENKKILKKIATMMVVYFTLTIFSSTVIADFQDKLYCTIQQETLNISLKKNNNYLCKNYILYLQNRIYKESKAINNINYLINKWENIHFWKEVRENKIHTINRINTVIKKIRYHMEVFETNLIHTIQKYLNTTLEKEKKYLDKLSLNLSCFNDQTPEIINVKQLVDTARTHINKIYKTEKMDILIHSLTDYFYIKKKITWILEL